MTEVEAAVESMLEEVHAQHETRRLGLDAADVKRVMQRLQGGRPAHAPLLPRAVPPSFVVLARPLPQLLGARKHSVDRLVRVNSTRRVF